MTTAVITRDLVVAQTRALTPLDDEGGDVDQGMALIVLGFAVAHWRGFIGDYPAPVAVEVRD